MRPRISVIIPTYRRRDSALRALRALDRQTLPPGAFEVILSIDGSEDGTREAAEALTPAYALRVLWQPNRGRAAACNAGIREARGELLVLLDDDMEPAPHHLAGHAREHERKWRLAVMGAAPIVIEADAPPAVRYIGAKFNRHMETLARPGHRFRLRNFYSGNLSIRSDLLREAGGFDEAFRVYGNEDLELCARLGRLGVELAFSSEALAHQHYEKDLDALARDNFDKGRTAVLLADKHPALIGELKLGSARRASRKRRLLLSTVLRLSGRRDTVPAVVVRLLAWLGEQSPDRMGRALGFALDYFFWLGVEAARRTDAERRRGPWRVPLTLKARTP